MKTWLLIAGLVFLTDGLCEPWVNPFFTVDIPDELSFEADDHRLLASGNRFDPPVLIIEIINDQTQFQFVLNDVQHELNVSLTELGCEEWCYLHSVEKNQKIEHKIVNVSIRILTTQQLMVYLAYVGNGQMDDDKRMVDHLIDQIKHQISE
jgi:hypothetical protein